MPPPPTACATGRFYEAFETPTELDLKRKKQLNMGKPPVYDRAALALSEDEKARAAGRARARRLALQARPGADRMGPTASWAICRSTRPRSRTRC
jgi:glutamyl/glutaminyl-tRNA synthetase